MHRWKLWLLGALALAGLAFGQAQAKTAEMTPPTLSPLVAASSAAETAAPTCYWYGRRGYYRRGYYRGGYGWRRPYYGYRRGYYGWRRPYGYYGRYGYGWRRPWGYRRYYGWRRW